MVEVQGHRGYGNLAAQNSLRAFDLAGKDENVVSVEFDVRRTKDDVLVVSRGSGREEIDQMRSYTRNFVGGF